ncbi:uncharacterized protein LOC127750226 [Frankliniella occidentalis]|uniref:Uncharacterized protein LOC127750226 n=1 Tax=Frankliniella occidentalis TaxID=133901 RepID=A0A9C6XQ60_FRAOC|nr:uncharacterized protein LOC127750226 [Frankliniella occidentalis]
MGIRNIAAEGSLERDNDCTVNNVSLPVFKPRGRPPADKNKLTVIGTLKNDPPDWKKGTTLPPVIKIIGKSKDHNRTVFSYKNYRYFTFRSFPTIDCEQIAESSNEYKKTNQRKGSPKTSKVVNKKKSIKKSINFDNEIINNVSDKVFKHLKKTERLPVDQTGKIDLGYGISVPDESFRKNFKDNRLDMDKAAKNMTSMVWSRSERLSRSLEGQGTNRFKDSTPKQPATPAKVQVILGCLKGHMLKEGDTEGPRMASSFKSCAKAIGDKFAQDAYNKKREEARAAKAAAEAANA